MPDREETLRLGIDSRGARQGAAEVVRSLEDIRQKSREGTDAFERMTQQIRSGLGTLAAFVGAGAIMRQFVHSTEEAQDVQAQLAARLRSTHGAAGQTIESLNHTATALQGVTRYGDEAVGSVQAMLLTFTNVRGEVFDQATRSVLNLATAMGGDTQGAAIQLGKALNDPVHGITALTRVGVTFSATQKDMIKDMVQAGNVAGAQRIILRELETEFGGAAEAARGTLGGALSALRERFGDMFEVSTGGTRVMVQGIEFVTAHMTGLFRLAASGVVLWTSYKAVTLGVAAADAIMAAGKAAVTTATAAESLAFRGATAAIANYQTAAESAGIITAGMAAAETAAAGATTGLAVAGGGLLAILGGPVGIALLLAGVVTTLGIYAAKAQEAAASTETFRLSLLGLSKESLRINEIRLAGELAHTNAERERMSASGEQHATYRTTGGHGGMVRTVRTVDPHAENPRYTELTNQAKQYSDELDIVRQQIAAFVDVPKIDLNVPDPEAMQKAANAARELRDALFTDRYRPFGEMYEDAAKLRTEVHSLAQEIADAGRSAPAGAEDLLNKKRQELAETEATLERLRSRGVTLDTDESMAKAIQDVKRLGNEIKHANEPIWDLNNAVVENAYAWDQANGKLALFIAGANGLHAVTAGLAAVNNSAARTLSDFSNLASAAGQFSKALSGRGGMGIPDTTSMITTGVALLSTGLSLVGGLFGGNKEHEEILRRNNEALERLRSSLDSAAGTFGRQSDALRLIQMMTGRSPFGTRFGEIFGGSSLDEALAATGLTKAQLEALGKSQGIDLFDEKGRLVGGTLDQLGEAIHIAALSVTKFGESLDGARRLAEARRDIYDITDPAAAVKDQYDLLLKGLSESAETRFGLVGLDTNTAAGQKALEQGLRGLIDAFTSGQLDPLKDLAGFSSVDDFLQALLGADNALDRLAETSERLNKSMLNAPAGYRLAGGVYAAQDPRVTGPALPPVSLPPISIPITVDGQSASLTVGQKDEAYGYFVDFLRSVTRDLPDSNPVGVVVRRLPRSGRTR